MAKTQGPGPDELDVLANDVASIARILLAPGHLTDILERVVTLSRRALDGCDEAGTCSLAVGPDEVPDRTEAGLAVELDDLQTRLDEGPCVDTHRGAATVYSSDLTDEPRWPQFAPAAAAVGLRSALAYRLFAGDETLGALHMYSRTPAAFGEEARAQGLVFAAHAALALKIAQRQEGERNVAEHLQSALVSREVIGQAQGILMERERITADQAFDLLRHSSQELNVKLRTIAQDLVDTGAMPVRERAAGTPNS